MSTSTAPITQSALDSYLWGAAPLLRGYIDAGDYKQFIFPLLFYSSPMEACIVICRMNKPKARWKNKVLFINAVGEVNRERAQSFLTDDRIVEAYRRFEDVDGFCKVASVEEIEGQGANLSIPLYLRGNGEKRKAGAPNAGGSLEDALAEWQRNSTELRESMAGLVKCLEKGS